MSETRSVETSAADIETAIELGLEQLGVTRESVIVEILDEPSRGLLGLGARQARIRLTTAAPPRKPAQPETPPPAPQAVAQPAAQPKAAPQVVAQPAAQSRAAYEADVEDDRLAFGEEDEDVTPVSDKDMTDDARVGLATLEELLKKMTIEAQVEVYRAKAAPDETAPWVLQIRGHDLGMLIGRRGETLAALQYITRLIASRELQRRADIVLDVEGYKQRREQMLRRLAKRMADQAIQMGRTVALEPMSPYERRIVHLTLHDNPDVMTESTGEGDHRKVTIVPRRRK